MREEWEINPKGPNWFLILLILILAGLIFVGIIITFKVDVSSLVDNKVNNEAHVEEEPEFYCTEQQINDMFSEIYKVVNDPDVRTIEYEYGKGYDGSSKLMIITTDENDNVNYFSYRSDCMD